MSVIIPGATGPRSMGVELFETGIMPVVNEAGDTKAVEEEICVCVALMMLGIPMFNVLFVPRREGAAVESCWTSDGR